MNGTLCAVHTCTIEVDRHLVGSHRVFLVTTLAVSPDARGSMALKHFEKALTSIGSHASGNTIGRNAVDPNDLIGHLNSAIRLVWSQGVATTEHLGELS